VSCTTFRTPPRPCARSTASYGRAVTAWSCSTTGGRSTTTSTSCSCAGWERPSCSCQAPCGCWRLTGKSEEALSGHRALLRRHGLAYLTDRRLFLSNNTDGLGNPLSKVFSRRQARDLFADFDEVETQVHFLDLRELPPLLDRLLGRATRERLGRRLGWQLYVRATRS
jgi:hypothetical protein